MMVSECALIIASVTSLVWGAERGGGYSCVGQGVYGCESKTALRKHGL